jgi:hypothetical protein
MAYQWLVMRISEENDRRKKEENTLQRLPTALDEVYSEVKDCVDEYRTAFGDDSVDLQRSPDKIRIAVRGEKEAHAEVVTAPKIPGFQVDRGVGGEPLMIEVGVLPGDKLYFRDLQRDQYVTMEDLTRRILDRVFFPKLNE